VKIDEFMQETFSPAKGSIKLNTKGIIEGYRERYDRLIKSDKQFQSSTYNVVPGNRIIVHIKEPSESVDNFFYDILFELTAGNSAADFRDCDVKFFSNCPSFVYSVAYVFAHWAPSNAPAKNTSMMIDSLRGKLPRERMLIPGTEKALGKKPVHDEPVTRNPMGIPLPDKSIYFGLFYLMDHMNFAEVMHNHHAVAMVKVVASVEDFERLMIKRKRAEQDQKSAKAAQQKRVKDDFVEHEKGIAQKNRQGLKRPKTAVTMKTASKSSGMSTMKKPKSPKRV